MMRLIVLLTSLILVAAALMWVSHHPGTLTLHWMGFYVEVSVTLFVGLIILGLFGSTVVVRLALFLWRLPGRMRRHWRRRRDRKHRLFLLQGVDGLVHRCPGRVLSRLSPVEGGGCSDTDPLWAYLEGHGALLTGDSARAERAFDGLTRMDGCAGLGYAGLAAVYGARSLYDKALFFADKAIGADGGYDAYYRLAVDLCQRDVDQDRKLAYLERLGRLDKAGSKIYDGRRAETYGAMAAAALHLGGGVQKAFPLFEKAIALDPQNVDILLAYVRALLRDHQGDRAASLILKTYKTRADRRLAALYVQARLGADERLNSSAVFKVLTDLIGEGDDRFDSHLVLAEAAINARVWGLARTFLNRLMGQDVLTSPDGPLFCALMAMLEDQSGEDGQGPYWRQKQLALLTQSRV